MQWDDKRNEWELRENDESMNFLLPKRPAHLIGLQRPATEYAIQMSIRENTSRSVGFYAVPCVFLETKTMFDDG